MLTESVDKEKEDRMFGGHWEDYQDGDDHIQQRYTRMPSDSYLQALADMKLPPIDGSRKVCRYCLNTDKPLLPYAAWCQECHDKFQEVTS